MKKSITIICCAASLLLVGCVPIPDDGTGTTYGLNDYVAPAPYITPSIEVGYYSGWGRWDRGWYGHHHERYWGGRRWDGGWHHGH